MPLGVNVPAVTYYSTALAFVDLTAMGDSFFTFNATWVAGLKNAWNSELIERVARDEAGYPLELPALVSGAEAPQAVRMLLAPMLYEGTYTLLYDGDGEVQLHPRPHLHVVSSSPGRIVARLDKSSNETFVLQILRSKRGDHVRNVRLLAPGFAEDGATLVFHPDYVSRLAGMSTLRFMDAGRINASPLVRWRDRPKPSDLTQGTEKGVPLETMIALSNRVGADPWFCVPHLADDEYVEQMAKLIRERLDAKRKIYVEYSNELWNVMFKQARDASELGCKAGLAKLEPYPGDCSHDGVRMWAGMKWTAKRSAEVFRIFKRVFGDDQRLVRVLAGQAYWTHRNEQLLAAYSNPAINSTREKLDAFAIAPYFGGGFVDGLVKEGRSSTLTVDEILNLAEASLPAMTTTIRESKALADRYHVRLIAYEGGQHIVAGHAGENDEALTAKLIAANRHPRMGALYDAMFERWYEASGNGLFMIYTYIDGPSRHGSWGLLESSRQANAEAPKFLAADRALRQLQADVRQTP